ncbi:MAG: APC family permease [Candidatus Nanopelagicales bacterium]
MTQEAAKAAGTGSGGGSIGLAGAVAIGIGGMMGAGIYTLLGLAAKSSGPLLPLSFLVAGFVTIFSVYSYAKLATTFPSRGGPAEFLNRGFGPGLLSGGLNVFQYVAYIIAISLYAASFAEYLGTFLPEGWPSWTPKVTGTAVVVLFVGLNVLGSRLVGRAETFIVGIELVILLAFVVIGLFHADPSRLGAGGGEGAFGVVAAAGLLYITYQGFGVVTTVAGSMERPRRDVPRAMFISLGLVALVYLLVSTTVVTVLNYSDILASSGHALAIAGQEVLGQVGFVAIGVSALLATASAVNATMFGSANLSYQVAKDKELPREFTRDTWHGSQMSLFVTAGLVILFVIFFPLEAVGQMGSMAFLLVYAAVSVAHLRVRSQTKAHAWPLVTAVVLNLALFAMLFTDTAKAGNVATWATLLGVLVLSFVAEALLERYYRREDTARTPTAG